MSRCEACASEKTCHPKDSSRFYRKDGNGSAHARL